MIEKGILEFGFPNYFQILNVSETQSHVKCCCVKRPMLPRDMSNQMKECLMCATLLRFWSNPIRTLEEMQI
jgi:hypothetical protein